MESLKLLKPLIEDLIGGAELDFEKGNSTEKDHKKCHSSLININQTKYRISITRNKLKLTPIEIKIFDNAIKVFETLHNSLSGDNEKYIRDGVVFSAIDIGIARFLKDFSKGPRPIWTILNLLYVLKKLSFERYEGEPATTGFYIHRKKDTEKIDTILRESAENIGEPEFDFEKIAIRPISIDNELFRGPLAYRYIDGSNCLYCADIEMNINTVIRAKNYGEYDAIERLCNFPFQKILDQLNDRSFQANLNRNSEIEISLVNQRKLIWRKGRWLIFNPTLFEFFIGSQFPHEESTALYKAAYALSKIRHGALILVIADNKIQKYENLKKNSVAGEHTLSKRLIKFNKHKSINELKQNGALIRMLSSDGLTVIDTKGKLIDTSAVIDTSIISQDTTVSGGGRTTAALAASNLGKVIKISEDGPIDFFHKEEKIYRFG